MVVFIGRLVDSQHIFKADNRHLHHRLQRLGYSHSQTVCLEYLLAALLGFVPLLIQSPLRFRWLGFALLVIMLYLIASKRESDLDTPSLDPFLRKLIKNTIMSVLGFAFLIQIVDAGTISLKYGIMPAFIALAFATWSHFRLKKQDSPRLSITLALMMATILFVFHMHNASGFPWVWGPARLHLYLWIGIGLFSGIVLLFLDRKIAGSPLELLIIVCTVSLFFLPAPLKGTFRTDALAVELLAFYAVLRVLFLILEKKAFERLQYAAAIWLAVITLTGLTQI
jgi:hypothetical protein